MNKGFILTKPKLVIVAAAEKQTKMVLVSCILVLSGLNEVCFMMVKLLFLKIESGEFDMSKKTAASG